MAATTTTPITTLTSCNLDQVQVKMSLEAFRSNNILFNMALNAFLVKTGARKATLLEFNNFSDMKSRAVSRQAITVWCNYLELYLTPCDKYHTWVTCYSLDTPPSTEEEYAHQLGFHCAGHDFSNVNIERTSGVISVATTNDHESCEIYVEVGEKNRFDMDAFSQSLQAKCENFNTVFERYKLPYKASHHTVNHLPQQYYMDRYRDFEFVREHLTAFRNILYNDFPAEGKFDADGGDNDDDCITTRFPLFVFIMDKIALGTFERMAQIFVYEEMRDRLRAFEAEIWNAPSDKYESLFQKHITSLFNLR